MFILFQGCSLYHFLSVEEKKYDTEEEVYTFLEELEIDTNFSYSIKQEYLDSLSFEKYALSTYKLEHKGKASAVQIRLYDTTNGFVYGWEQCFGDLKKLGILKSFPFSEKAHLPVNRNLFLLNEIDIIKLSAKEKDELLVAINKYDNVVIVYWSIWSGWYSKDALKRVNSFVAKHSSENILFLKINVSPKV